MIVCPGNSFSGQLSSALAHHLLVTFFIISVPNFLYHLDHVDHVDHLHLVHHHQPDHHLHHDHHHHGCKWPVVLLLPLFLLRQRFTDSNQPNSISLSHHNHHCHDHNHRHHHHHDHHYHHHPSTSLLSSFHVKGSNIITFISRLLVFHTWTATIQKSYHFQKYFNLSQYHNIPKNYLLQI